MTTADDVRIEPAVVAALYLEHGDELKRFLVGVLRDAPLANDVLQATFVKLVEQGHTTRETSRKAWLFRVAFHEAMAVRRRQSVGDKVVRRLAWSKDAFTSPADEPLLQLEAVESVRIAMNQLPVEQQQVVRMRIYEEKTFAVIAQELNIPLGTALARMRSALTKLRKKLEDRDTAP